MKKKLPDKWRKVRKAKASHLGASAWWYGNEDGIHVCVHNTPPGAVPCAHIPKRMILKWADDIRKLGD